MGAGALGLLVSIGQIWVYGKLDRLNPIGQIVEIVNSKDSPGTQKSERGVYPGELNYDVIVIGAGAAGLLAAGLIGQRGRSVAVLEHMDRPGKKILISGGGRCNFTNLNTRPENFLSANPHFVKSALARYTPRDFLALVAKHRIAWHEKTLGQLFCDQSAHQILDLLLNECKEGRVAVKTGITVRTVQRDTHFVIQTSHGEFVSPVVIVATGGLSIPKIGATDFGYRLARQFGLKVESTYPALVPLVLHEADRRRWCDLAGVSCSVVASTAKARFEEKMLITHRGLSGPAILQVSSYWKRQSPLTLDLSPGKDYSSADPATLRSELLLTWSRRFGERWLENEGFTQPVLSTRKVEERIHRWTFTPQTTEGFDKAEVTGGGVSTAELSSRTMEAKNVPGLFFIGEVVDVTGHLGGYNFQWAWASAYAAAEAIAAAAS